MDRFDAMRLLVTAVDAGTLSAASRQLGTPLPTISRRIADLERQLNAKLLLRSSHGLVPTEAGRIYLAAARRILEEVDTAERAVAGEWTTPRGELVVAAPMVFGRLHMLPTVAAFLATFPAINVRLVLSDRNLGLAEDHVDVALRIGALPDSSLRVTRVGEVRRVAVASPDFLARHAAPSTPADLVSLPCIVFEGVKADRTWVFSAPGRGAEITVSISPRLAVDTVETSLDAAIAGVGIARALTYQCASALSTGSLVRVLQAFEPASVPVQLLHAEREPLPLKLRSFLDHATTSLRRRLDHIATMEQVG